MATKQLLFAGLAILIVLSVGYLLLEDTTTEVSVPEVSAEPLPQPTQPRVVKVSAYRPATAL